jgi:hypothetical protein
MLYERECSFNMTTYGPIGTSNAFLLGCLVLFGVLLVQTLSSTYTVRTSSPLSLEGGLSLEREASPNQYSGGGTNTPRPCQD